MAKKWARHLTCVGGSLWEGEWVCGGSGCVESGGGGSLCGGREAKNNLWKEMAKKWAEHLTCVGGRVSQRVSRAYSKSQLSFVCVFGDGGEGSQKWFVKRNGKKMSRTSNIESDNSQTGGLEDYNYISDGIFPHFTTPSIKNKLRVEQRLWTGCT